MNLTHLKYAVEVANTGSISKAADALFMGQPNLSRAIKELEETLGVVLFNRTTKGVSVTPQGEEFLAYARDILAQVEEMEALYRHSQTRLDFGVSGPRSGYISYAFQQFVRKLDESVEFELNYRETNSMRAIKNVVQGESHLGIIRCQDIFRDYFSMLLKEKGLESELLLEFNYRVLMSAEHPLAQASEISLADLSRYIEVSHGDPYVPFMPLAEVKKAELSSGGSKRIFVYGRGTQYDLLKDVEGAYCWSSPVPEFMLDRYNIIAKTCLDSTRVYQDRLVYKKNYRFSLTDKSFLQELHQMCADFAKNWLRKDAAPSLPGVAQADSEV